MLQSPPSSTVKVLIKASSYLGAYVSQWTNIFFAHVLPATLLFHAMLQSPPSSTVKVLIKASSYLGADVSGANIDITWTLPLASGAFNVTTDAKGLAEASIPLGQLPPKNASSLGDQLSLTAVWIGPTRERIRETAAVR